jgi:RNA polymerase-interacting CarD/CdnL/TRCF family regulator
MRAVDVINEIKTLTPEELAEVIRFLHELEAHQPAQVIGDQAFDAAAEQVLKHHVDLLQKLAS